MAPIASPRLVQSYVRLSRRLLILRLGEDEVHVAAGHFDPEVEPSYYEAGTFPGSDSGEQQCGRTKGKGISVTWLH